MRRHSSRELGKKCALAITYSRWLSFSHSGAHPWVLASSKYEVFRLTRDLGALCFRCPSARKNFVLTHAPKQAAAANLPPPSAFHIMTSNPAVQSPSSRPRVELLLYSAGRYQVT